MLSRGTASFFAFTRYFPNIRKCMRMVKVSKQNKRCLPHDLMSMSFLLSILSFSIFELPEMAITFFPLKGSISSRAIISDGPSGIVTFFFVVQMVSQRSTQTKGQVCFVSMTKLQSKRMYCRLSTVDS